MYTHSVRLDIYYLVRRQLNESFSGNPWYQIHPCIISIVRNNFLLRPLNVREIKEEAKDILYMDEINNECTLLCPPPKQQVINNECTLLSPPPKQQVINNKCTLLCPPPKQQVINNECTLLCPPPKQQVINNECTLLCPPPKQQVINNECTLLCPPPKQQLINNVYDYFNFLTKDIYHCCEKNNSTPENTNLQNQKQRYIDGTQRGTRAISQRS